MPSEQNNQRGFTLIEVIVVVAIGAIIAAVAVPNIRTFMERYQTKGAARDVMSALQQARSEAVRRARPVAVEFVHGTGGAGVVRIFVDDGANGLVFEAGETVVSTLNMPPRVQLSNADFDGTQITGFDSRGISRRDGSVVVTGPASTFTLRLEPAGRARIE